MQAFFPSGATCTVTPVPALPTTATGRAMLRVATSSLCTRTLATSFGAARATAITVFAPRTLDLSPYFLFLGAPRPIWTNIAEVIKERVASQGATPRSQRGRASKSWRDLVA
jgi:hypothetical protein